MIPKELADEIRLWSGEARFGNIQINFVNGKVRSWNLNQSVRPLNKSARSENTKVDATVAPKP